MIFHENPLLADDSHEISSLICYVRKSGKILNCHLLQIIGGALRVRLFLFFQLATVAKLLQGNDHSKH